MLKTKSIVPFGAVTIALFLATLLFSWWHDDSCETLQASVDQGYFLRWAQPQLLLITAKKETFMVEASSKSKACHAMLNNLNNSK
ncbi:hypothetical protein QNI23_017170 (plasmid) [Bermanella sp. WJH001]|uniref:hypothetical protein n=1 Tax=Bermanella sp. WJH001 TaxID=3048005 RepID=UPI0024BD817F|nr:hypothetical protein [Bermanella sp. WJH001]MDJ1539482.1 hypothetical protein [Bermanella sp. WJH001]